MEAKIYSAIIAVMRDCGSIGKDKQTTGYASFKFRGIDDVYNTLHPVMAKHGVFCVPEVLETTREERSNIKGTVMAYVTAKVRFTFYADDGSSVCCVTFGEAMDSGDKALPKAQSIAIKYAMFQTFCIPTEEMPDPDAETDQFAPRNGSAQQKAKTKEQTKQLREQAKAENPNPPHDSLRKAMFATLRERGFTSSESMKAELENFFGKKIETTNILTTEEIHEYLNACNNAKAEAMNA